MTIIADVKLRNGLNVENAIHRVTNVNVSYKNKMTYTIELFVDEGFPRFHSITQECPYSGGDAIAEAYDHYKTNLSDYTSA